MNYFGYVREFYQKLNAMQCIIIMTLDNVKEKNN